MADFYVFPYLNKDKYSVAQVPADKARILYGAQFTKVLVSLYGEWVHLTVDPQFSIRCFRAEDAADAADHIRSGLEKTGMLAPDPMAAFSSQ